MNALSRRLLAEFLGSAGLATVVIGSGVAASTLSPADVGLQLLHNAFATALGLTVLILVFAGISGAHFNPAVTLAERITTPEVRPWSESASYIAAQVLGCASGAVLAHAMFAQALLQVSTTQRASVATVLAEVVATAGLIATIMLLVRADKAPWVAPAVGAYIGAAYFFTSSTSFANPAITLGRTLTDTFAGIAPSSAPWFIAAQLVGAGIGVAVVVALAPVRTLPQDGQPVDGDRHASLPQGT